MPAFRYLVEDVERAVRFYSGHLGFAVKERWGPAFAIVERGGVELWLSGPGTSAARTLPDGRSPVPGGWNRLVLPVRGLESELARLAATGVSLAGTVVRGPGGSQAPISDGEGNFVELFEPAGQNG